jgi:septum formation protein
VPRLVLASKSPRRRELLEEAGYTFSVLPAEVEEPAPEPGEAAEAYAMRLARTKAEEVAGRLAQPTPQKQPLRLRRPGEGPGGRVVLGADTVVDLEGVIIGQPRSDDEARAILRRLSGSSHAVVTGVALVDVATGRVSLAAERTELVMLPVSDEEIDAYVASGEGRGKAGSYAIQESGDRFVRIVSGSRTNVVGLPMERLARMLREFAPEVVPGGRLGAQRRAGGVNRDEGG